MKLTEVALPDGWLLDDVRKASARIKGNAMSDLVERLLDGASDEEKCGRHNLASQWRTAAAELTRLREQCEAKDAEIERLKAASNQRRAPVQGFSAGIPWTVHCQAYDGYVARYGKTQSAETLAARGGFGVGELDMFYPNWRVESDAIASLSAENERLKAERDEALMNLTNEQCRKSDDAFDAYNDLASANKQIASLSRRERKDEEGAGRS